MTCKSATLYDEPLGGYYGPRAIDASAASQGGSTEASRAGKYWGKRKSYLSVV